nr:hypothetical protein [Tanacetum cinerariifolium]
MDARLDALSIEFNEELYPHMLTAIAGHRWVIGHGLRLAGKKCGESTELRQVFADVVSAWIAKGRDTVAGCHCGQRKSCREEKRCRVVCRTHGVGFANHARSDDVPVSVPTVASQGLAILLADAATQTETSEDGASPRLLRSNSLPVMYNID